MHTPTLRLLFLFLACVSVPVSAQTLYWNPTGSTEQQDGSGPLDATTPLWNTSPAPSDTLVAWTNGHHAVFGETGGTITADNVSLTTGNVIFQASSSYTEGYTLQGDLSLSIAGNLTLQDYGRLTVTGSLAINADLAIYNGTLTVDGGTFATTVNGYIGVDNLSQNGRLNIASGGSASFQHFSVGTLTGSYGFITVDGTGSALNISGNAYFGQDGWGSLLVSNGATATAANLNIGYSASGSGGVRVSGAGSTLTVTGELYVGRDGSGSLTVTDGGTVVWGDGTNELNLGANSTLRIGEGNDAVGTIQVASIGSTQSTATATVSFGHGEVALDFSTPLSGNLQVEHVGSGTTALSSYNQHTGGTIISAGTLVLGNYDALGSGPLTLAGGTLDMGGFSQSLNGSPLTLSGDSFLVFSGAGESLSFADSSALEWWGTLTIQGFTAGDYLSFGNDAGGLTPEQLAMVNFDGFAAVIDAQGYVTASAIPEPSTYAALLGAVAIALAVRRRRNPS